jgi:hypothetical protein
VHACCFGLTQIQYIYRSLECITKLRDCTQHAPPAHTQLPVGENQTAMRACAWPSCCCRCQHLFCYVPCFSPMAHDTVWSELLAAAASASSGSSSSRLLLGGCQPSATLPAATAVAAAMFSRGKDGSLVHNTVGMFAACNVSICRRLLSALLRCSAAHYQRMLSAGALAGCTMPPSSVLISARAASAVVEPAEQLFEGSYRRRSFMHVKCGRVSSSSSSTSTGA